MSQYGVASLADYLSVLYPGPSRNLCFWYRETLRSVKPFIAYRFLLVVVVCEQECFCEEVGCVCVLRFLRVFCRVGQGWGVDGWVKYKGLQGCRFLWAVGGW